MNRKAFGASFLYWVDFKGCQMSRWGKPFFNLSMNMSPMLWEVKFQKSYLIQSNFLSALLCLDFSGKGGLRLVTMGHFENWTLIFIVKSLWALLLLLNLDIHICVNVTKHTWKYPKTGSDKTFFWTFPSWFYFIKKTWEVVYRKPFGFFDIIKPQS